MTAYYNEHDAQAAAWLRELIAAGEIAPGVVDERSISDVTPNDLRGFTQCHFFAGIGGWSRALRLAGCSDNRRVWTGSCPCQPFSAAGAGAGFDDERHLWPDFMWLIAQCRPPIVFGEQVASPAGLEWLDVVLTDVEDAGYAGAAADLCAAGVGAPHIRQRLFWVADGTRDRRHEGRRAVEERPGPRDVSAVGGLGDAGGERLEGLGLHVLGRGQHAGGLEARRDGEGRVADPDGDRRRQAGRDAASGGTPDCRGQADRACDVGAPDGGADPDPTRLEGRGALWRDPEWLWCRDGVWRPTKPGLQCLAARLPRGVVPSGDPGLAVHTSEARVMRLRGYGNAIVPEVAAEFITTVLEVL